MEIFAIHWPSFAASFYLKLPEIQIFGFYLVVMVDFFTALC